MARRVTLKQVRFGVREVTYELGLLDSKGQLRRVEVSPTAARARGEQVVNLTHEGIRQIPQPDSFPEFLPKEWKDYWLAWAASLTPAGETSPAVVPANDNAMEHYLVLKVNGVRIAARGGSWGMDDSRKRVSREKLEPYFRLHRDANVNIIRNWMGQNTEETFFELADEYGMMVWNDFWTTTQDYNTEPLDIPLFLDNTRDTVLRFRNHPSIVMWCGRNEGVPSPILNKGIIDLLDKYDGTRYYSPSSNQVNLQNSGPYKFQDPRLYFTVWNHGFSVETGTVSLSTMESLEAWMPKEDQWPIGDAWAYHDWHQSGNGEIEPFMKEVETEFGAGTSLADFEKKAQMLQYVTHRAIFEGMDQHLWAPNSGPHVMDDTAGVAEQHVADTEFGLRYAGVVLRREEGVRVAARAIGFVGLQRCGREHYHYSAAGDDCKSDGVFARQQATAAARGEERRRGQ